MNIISYKYKDPFEHGWEFPEIEFKKINLLVGQSGTGKTKIINTIFNLGRFVCMNEFKRGHWKIKFEHNSKLYSWEIKSHMQQDLSEEIMYEELTIDGESTPIVKRDSGVFLFKGALMPKLSSKQTSINIFKEESLIKPIFNAFSRITTRRFSTEIDEKVFEIHTIPKDFFKKMEQRPSLEELYYNFALPLNLRLYFLKTFFKDNFDTICREYKAIFPFIKEVNIKLLGDVKIRAGEKVVIPLLKSGSNVPCAEAPVFCITEHSSNNDIVLRDLSSGMNKVLLILTDLYSQPEETLYIIDEYENSLGPNTLGFFQEAIDSLDSKQQVILTSHNPYIINNIPVGNWYIFNRKGQTVSVKYGDKLEKEYGNSKQEAFCQLSNDPFYLKSVE